MKTDKNGFLKRKIESYEVVVCGGGLAGVCAALASSRNGAKTCIINDRPVFGGNSSSEIKIKPLGPDRHHVYARATGIISELLIRERAENHVKYEGDNGYNNSVFDMILYDSVVSEKNLTFHLNTLVTGVTMKENRIKAVSARVLTADTELTIHGQLFIDCTGDGVVAAASGCEWRMGQEAKEEYGESLAPEEATDNTMGNSIHFTSKDTGRPAPFKAPDWAVKYEDPNFFYGSGRGLYHHRAGYWWIELGTPLDTIYDSEELRHELTRHTLGIWDFIKNKDPRFKEIAKNFALDWVGQVPGKRDSRRIMGLHMLKQQDIENNTEFSDEVAYGGFFIDLHTIGGLLAENPEPVNATSANRGKIDEKSDAAVRTYVKPYGIPLRSLISKDVSNLMMAGRNISTTHVALGTVRVMSTTALMGQAAGTAAAFAAKEKIDVSEVVSKHTFSIKQRLLRDGCFLPHNKNEDPLDIARTARVIASSSYGFTGVGPSSTGALNHHFSFIGNKPYPLNNKVGQWIAVGEDKIDTLSVCLTNQTMEIQNIGASVVEVSDIWDYKCGVNKMPLAETVLEVMPGKKQWVSWNVKLDKSSGLESGKYVRLDLASNPNLCWEAAGTELPCHMSAFEMAPGKLRKISPGITMSFKVYPEQHCFNPDNVLSGYTRPYQYTNMWLSDIKDPLPAWLELQWDTVQTFNEIQLTFPGNLNYEYGDYPPFYSDPQVAENYGIYAWINNSWAEILHITGNYQSMCRHSLDEKISSGKLRVVIYNTNGEQFAGISEIRVY